MNKIPMTAALVGASLLGALSASANDDLFNGPFGNLHVGAGIVKLEGTTFVGPIKESDLSLLAGGSLGYRTTLGQDSPLVVGFEATGNYYAADSDIRLGISALAGFKVSERGLAYLRVGYGKLYRDLEDLDGMVFGGGFEFKLTEDTNIRLDYKKLNYKDTNFPDNSIRYDGHEITSGMVFRF